MTTRINSRIHGSEPVNEGPDVGEETAETQLEGMKNPCEVDVVAVSAEPSIASTAQNITESASQNQQMDMSIAGAAEIPLDAQTKAWRVSDFLVQHFALISMRKTATDKNPSWVTRSPSKSTSEVVVNYQKALQEFQESQLEQVAASLISSEDESMEALARNRKAVEAALESSNQSLDESLLCQWNSMLLGEQGTAGSLRTTAFRVGESSPSTPPGSIPKELTTVMSALKSMEEQHMPYGKDLGDLSSLPPLTFAASAFFAIETIKPFSSSNPQMSQLVLNWAMRRFGIPILLHLCETPSQRVEYIAAIESTRRKIENSSKGLSGDNSEFHWLQCLTRPSMLSPLISLLADRTLQAMEALGTLVSAKDELATEETEARAVRRAREHQAEEGTCIICFDEAPNMATLCCGKAVHLNCIAEWLNSHPSCPQCRHDLPPLQLSHQNRRTTTLDEDDDSMVEHLLNYITNDTSDDDSSSDSSSSSSSSSSESSESSSETAPSSTSVMRFEDYNYPEYRIEYSSSDDEQDRTRAYEFLINSSEIEMVGDDDTNAGLSWRRRVAALESSSSVESSQHEEYTVGDFDDGGENEASRNDEDTWFNDNIMSSDDALSDDDDGTPLNSNSVPRLSFLDPSLLNDIHNSDPASPTPFHHSHQDGYAGSVASDHSHDSDASSTDAELPVSMRPVSLESPMGQRRGSPYLERPWRGEHPLSFAQPSWMAEQSSSDEEDTASHEVDDSGDGLPSGRMRDPPAFCLHENCMNRAARGCCNKMCEECCRDGPVSCARHGTPTRAVDFDYSTS